MLVNNQGNCMSGSFKKYVAVCAFTLNITAFIRILINMFWTLLTLLSVKQVNFSCTSNSLAVIVNFWISQGSVVTQVRWHENCYQAFFMGIHRWKNFFINRLIFAEVTTKNKVSVFSGTPCMCLRPGPGWQSSGQVGRSACPVCGVSSRQQNRPRCWYSQTCPCVWLWRTARLDADVSRTLL